MEIAVRIRPSGRKARAQRQEGAGVGAVAHTAHEKLGQGIGCGIQAQHKAQFGLGKTQGRHGRDGHGKVLANQIETGIADESAHKNLQAHAFVLGVGLRAGLSRKVGRLLKEF